MKPANVREVKKDANCYAGRSTTMHNSLFCIDTLCMNCVPEMFLHVHVLIRC